MAETWSQRKARGYSRPHRAGYDLACVICEQPMYRGPGSRPQGEATCRACRAIARGGAPSKRRTCPRCGEPCYGERCKPCANKEQQIRSDDDRRVQRWRRACAAPGLNSTERTKLLARWKAQRASCIFCGELATTIDHLVPLVRGGTNYEGNLAPACKRCNSSKGGKFISEWRHDCRPGYMRQPLPWGDRQRPLPARPKFFAPESPISICPCGTAHTRSSEFCSTTCQMRITYRRKVGIADDAPRYSRAGQPPGDAANAA